MPESRSEKRKERYKELRALGFTVADARRYRDRSGDNIDRFIRVEQRRISRKPIALRSSRESFRLSRIRNYRSQPSKKSRRFDSREARWRQFSKWSKNNKFPKWAQDRIVATNRRAGKDSILDGFGYRQFYYEYVERLDDGEISDIVDRNDSGMRWRINMSLVIGRTNLRRLINPPKDQAKAS